MSSLPARMLLSLMLCCCGSAWAASAADSPRWPAQGAVSPDIVSLGDCFARSYDQWMDRLREKNNFLVALALRWKFPEAQYERYRRELDCRAISYRSDGYVVHGWLVRPKGATGGGRLPVIVFNRGGNGSYGALTFASLFSHVFPLAERGYLVAASQYRGAIDSENTTSSPDQFGGDDVHDVTRLLGITAALPGADPRNLFMVGQSRGAIMTFRALRETRLPVRAVAIYSGAYDLHDLLRFRPEFGGLYEALIPGYRQHPRAALDRRSVTMWPDKLPAATGVLLFHGGDDERTPVASARRFDEQLRRLGRPRQLVIYPGESHFLDGVRPDLLERTLRWFDRFRVPPEPHRADGTGQRTGQRIGRPRA